jgi:glycosyltransferase involved in cell wall biosynthesis
LKIGIDADPVGRDGSGNETYLRGLIGAMDETARPGDELVLFGCRTNALNEVGQKHCSVVGCKPGLVGELALGATMRRHRVEVALAHYNLPIGLGCPAATIVHDVSFLRLPETFEPKQAARLRFSIHRSVTRSAATVTVSEFSKREILECYPRVPEERIVVAPNAAAPRYFARATDEECDVVRRRYDLPEVFILSVGNIQPRKNLARTARAAQHCDVPLVAVGRPHGKLVDTPVSKGVRFTGYVPDADLWVLYQLCSVFCYVSLYEGFGLPVLEALASGAVVVTSETSALPEVAGSGALFVDPVDVDSIAEGISEALSNAALRERLKAQGPREARRYSWTASASSVLERLKEISG